MEESLKKQTDKQLHKAHRKLRVARKNFADGFYEDAVSRAYYAMFHAAKALLLTKHLDAKTHSGLINLFNQHYKHHFSHGKSAFPADLSPQSIR